MGDTRELLELVEAIGIIKDSIRRGVLVIRDTRFEQLEELKGRMDAYQQEIDRISQQLVQQRKELESIISELRSKWTTDGVSERQMETLDDFEYELASIKQALADPSNTNERLDELTERIRDLERRIRRYRPG